MLNEKIIIQWSTSIIQWLQTIKYFEDIKEERNTKFEQQRSYPTIRYSKKERERINKKKRLKNILKIILYRETNMIKK